MSEAVNMSTMNFKEICSSNDETPVIKIESRDQIEEEYYVKNYGLNSNFHFIEVSKIDVKDETELVTDSCNIFNIDSEDNVREDKDLNTLKEFTQESLLQQALSTEENYDVDNCSAHENTRERNIQSGQTFQTANSARLSVKESKKKLDCFTPYVTEILSKLDSIQEVATDLKETEFDAWAKSLAIQLNSMEPCRALDLQLKIQTLLSRERIAHENKN